MRLGALEDPEGGAPPPPGPLLVLLAPSSMRLGALELSCDHYHTSCLVYFGGILIVFLVLVGLELEPSNNFCETNFMIERILHPYSK